jgi:1-deoxy-D-xylulose-5-phosphate reductoisomerase
MTSAQTTSPKPLLLLGATGSIGQSTLDLVSRLPGRFRVAGASAQRRAHELVQLARAFEIPRLCVVDGAARAELVREAPDLAPRLTAAGAGGLLELVAACPGATVVNGLVGAAGLAPTVAALRAGMDVALANKEALVVGGPLLLEAARQGQSRLWPVDSEHSAIAQCLRGNPLQEVFALWLTASGGPFRDRDPRTLGQVSVAEVLAHPTWQMGPKITVDSATMMNKGLEVLEAHLLFGIDLAHIHVVIHRQSIIHSMVEFVDGAVLAQLGAPDMRIPILYALEEGAHREADLQRYNPVSGGPLTFEEPDPARYPCLALARRAAAAGGGAPVVLNAANEEAVAGVLREELSFAEIPRVIEWALGAIAPGRIASVEDALQLDAHVRARAREWVLARAR